MGDPTYRVTTLGCRVNRADSLAIERDLSASGYLRAPDGDVPDVWVVNTCAVTSEGMRKSRKAVRRIASTGARVIVTGCGVDFERGAFEIGGVEGVFANRGKESLVASVLGPHRGGHPGARPDLGGLVRVPVKVQDGCRRFCAYCIVPYLRPDPCSRAAGSVVREVEELRDAGAGEIILCGIDLGAYRDPDSGGGLASLIEAASAVMGGTRLRLSSIDITDVDEGLLDAMSRTGVCRHLHLPLQSGDDATLGSMGRRYSAGLFRERVEEIKKRLPAVAVTSDVMVGFPTENEVAHGRTMGMVKHLGFSRLHVFKYSPRLGTRAFAMGDPVSGRTKHRRALEMREVARTTAAKFHAGLVGRIIPVLVEDSMKSEPGRLFGRAECFAGAIFEGDARLVGKRVLLRVTSSDHDGVRGEITGISPRDREVEQLGG